ncbi:hypothetical protein [Cerasicoccus arenae]|uniref:Inositol monophosphatase n=1 Tax=Cerasicoccus arenae TaxID=424488 RepID=A0A8J3GDQ8_9BACT|nr:hypothetical protein [Cerasicoccus arenae]MBK1857960.1 hypothetical protein [Cerasicoccus arenae]GHB97805.1 hypothetical protein GCM10007047_12130 [Cerasicoccus arenae]
MSIIVADQWETARKLLCALQDHLLAVILSERTQVRNYALHDVSNVTPADTIYQIDKISEAAILDWFAGHWPADWPVEIVMEGLEEIGPLTFPTIDVEDTIFKCIIDPIDGTRGIMYDKRPAWVLTGLAPQRGASTCLQDIVVSVMTELPITKQWRADQMSTAPGGTLVAESINVLTGSRTPLVLQPSSATNLEHGFAAMNRFFPAGMALLAEMEVDLWHRVAPKRGDDLAIFTDQYLTTGGQLYELMAGRDRFIADLRPWVFRELGIQSGLTCHPYDICVLPLAATLGVIVEDPFTGQVNAPLDTTTPVGWVGYANADLHALISPHLRAVLHKYCPSSW